MMAKIMNSIYLKFDELVKNDDVTDDSIEELLDEILTSIMSEVKKDEG